MKNLSQAKANGPEISGILYAPESEFCRIFNEEMKGLYWLALLLTADHAKAEQCFVASLEECMQTGNVFKEWAHSWSKRTIIKKAIQMINPVPREYRITPEVTSSLVEVEVGTNLSAVVGLESFQRFVLVMSVLEGYSNQDCATLLNCTRHDVLTARILAVKQLAQAGVDANAKVESGSPALNLASLALSGA